ncbi:MAG: hypothetical protein AAFU53_10955 [Cyanobacteria bacterium J06632_3]
MTEQRSPISAQRTRSTEAKEMSQAIYITRSFQRENDQWVMKGYSTQKYADLVGFWPVADEKLESDWVSPAGNLRYKVEQPRTCPDCDGFGTCNTCNSERLVLSDPNIEGAWVPMSAGWGNKPQGLPTAESVCHLVSDQT